MIAEQVVAVHGMGAVIVELGVIVSLLILILAALVIRKR